MTIAELVAHIRTDLLDDAIEPYIWSDAQLTRYAEEAILEACRRAPLIKRVVSKAVTANVSLIILPGTLRQIQFAKLSSANAPLTQTTDAELSTFVGLEWRTHTGTPTHYVRSGSKLTLYPVPTANDTLVINGISLPDDDFDLETDIDPGYWHLFNDYIAFKAYSLADSDGFSPGKAKEHAAGFEASFGKAKSARYEQFAIDNPLYTTTMGGRIA